MISKAHHLCGLDSLSGLNYHQAPSCTSFSNVTFTNLHDYIDIIYFHMCEIMYTPAPCLYYLPWLCLWNFLSQAQPKQCSVLKKNAVYLSLWSHNPWSISWGTFYCKEGKLWNLQSQVKNDTMWSFSKKIIKDLKTAAAEHSTKCKIIQSLSSRPTDCKLVCFFIFLLDVWGLILS